MPAVVVLSSSCGATFCKPFGTSYQLEKERVAFTVAGYLESVTIGPGLPARLYPWAGDSRFPVKAEVPPEFVVEQ